MSHGVDDRTGAASEALTRGQQGGSTTAQGRRPGARRGLAAHPLAREAGIVLVAYLLYGQVRNLIEGRVSTAEDFASWLLSLERSWGIDVELAINRWVAAREPVAVAVNYYYATLHPLVPMLVLVWLWQRYPSSYSLARTSLVLGSLVALLGYWLLPLAPPRLLPGAGYVDTFWFYDTWGSLSDPALARFSNQYAAMPSLHVGWALWVGVVLVLVSHRWWVRALGIAYPTLTLLVVIATANHFILDAVGSVVVMASGALVATVLVGPPHLKPSRPVAAATIAAVMVVVALLVAVLRPPY